MSTEAILMRSGPLAETLPTQVTDIQHLEEELFQEMLEYHPEGKERYSTDYRVTNLPLLVRAGQSRRASPASFALGCLGCSKIVASRFARTNGCHEFWQSTAR